MNLDLRTIVVLMVIGSVVMALTLAVGCRMGCRAGRGSSLGKWSLGLGLYAVAWTLIALRDALPAWIGIAFADALLVSGLCVQLVAIIEFGGRQAARGLVYLPGPLVFAVVMALLDDYPALNVLVSLASGVTLGASAIAAVELGRRAGRSRWMLAIGCSAGALTLTLRALYVGLAGSAYSNVFAASDLHIVTFMVLFAITIVASVAFLLMHRERAEAELYRLATCDSLTGLFNRRAFVDLAEREFARGARAGSTCAVLMMDLDHFKHVNDAHGHQAGDRVLAAFAAVARQALRSEDLVGRYGGEEFCAVLPEVTLAQALAVAERLRAGVSRTPLAGLPKPITISIGVTVCRPNAGTSLDAVLASADAALYRAKQEGRNRVVGLEYDPAEEASRRPDPSPDPSPAEIKASAAAAEA